MGCNRLAIVDREAGAQPLFNEDGAVVAVFNGEIYNYLSLAVELERAGHRFRTHSDSEVILHGYEQWGDQLLERLEGMYAFVVYDQNKSRIWAARDPFGIKPLYYARTSEGQLFASEMKALLRLGATDLRVVPPGGYVKNGIESPRLNFPRPQVATIAEENAKTILRQRLRQSVGSMLQTDLPVAVLCSGGIDSTAVLYEATQTSAKITAYAIGVSEDAPDMRFAADAARVLNVPFRPVIVSQEALLCSIPAVIASIESFEPNHIRGGTLSYALAEAVHRDGIKIAICGEGADELLAGYPEFQEHLDAPDSSAAIQKEVERFTGELHKTQLQRVDRTNMAWSVEVRVPFLDLRFAAFALSLPPALKLKRTADGSPTAKWILREAYRGILPDQIVDRRKTVISEGAGFGDNSSNSPFFEYAENTLTDSEFASLQASFPQFNLRSKEEAFYFGIFHSNCGALPLAADRPRVNCQSTRG